MNIKVIKGLIFCIWIGKELPYHQCKNCNAQVGAGSLICCMVDEQGNNKTKIKAIK